MKKQGTFYGLLHHAGERLFKYNSLLFPLGGTVLDPGPGKWTMCAFNLISSMISTGAHGYPLHRNSNCESLECSLSLTAALVFFSLSWLSGPAFRRLPSLLNTCCAPGYWWHKGIRWDLSSQEPMLDGKRQTYKTVSFMAARGQSPLWNSFCLAWGWRFVGLYFILLMQDILFCHLAIFYVPYLAPKDLGLGYLT